MADKVLVAYESRGGATREIAEEVSLVLAAEGLEPDVRGIRDQLHLADYDAYIIGAPVRMGRWAPRMTKFLLKGATRMSEKPVAVFAVGASFAPPQPGVDLTDPKSVEAAEYAEKCRLEVARGCEQLHPVAFATFPGVMRAAAFPAPTRWAMGVAKLPAEDVRDWGEIRAWAAEAATQLKAKLAPVRPGMESSVRVP